jgi:hypothetical protein
MRWYHDLVVRVSHSAWLWVMSAVFAFGSLYFVFLNINVPFEQMVGAPMFDFQNGLTVAQVFEQLPGYDERAIALYHAFLFVDFYFPFFAGLVMASAGAFAWRHLAPRVYEALDSRSLFVIFLVPTLFDWGENLFAIAVVGAWPERLGWAATLLVLCKKGKLATVMAFQAVVLISLLAAAAKWSHACLNRPGAR